MRDAVRVDVLLNLKFFTGRYGPLLKPLSWLRGETSSRFLWFYCLTTVLPVVVIGGALLHTLNTTLNDQLRSVLNLGRHLVLTTIEKDLEGLEITAGQVSLLMPSLHLEARSQNLARLNQALDRVRQHNHLEALLFLRGGQWAGKGPPPYGILRTSSPAQQLIQRARQGYLASSLAVVPTSEGGLYYLAVAPVFSPNDPQHVSGVLLLGQAFQDHFGFNTLHRLLPQLAFRIYQWPVVDGGPAVYRSTPNLPTSSPRLSSHAGTFTETIHGTPWKSMAFLLRENPVHHEGPNVAQVVISTQETQEMDLKRQGLMFLGATLLLGLLVLMLLGWWFSRSYVGPLQSLAQTADAVAEGALSARVSTSVPSDQMRSTLERFNRMVAQLERDDALRDAFIATLTHDLRTPLLAEGRVIELLTASLQAGITLPPPQKEKLLASLQLNNQHLLHMVNQLLQAYQMDQQGVSPFSPHPVDLNDIAKECFTRLDPLLADKQAVLAADIPSDFPTLLVDSVLITRLMENLLANALENSPPQSQITVRALLEPTTNAPRIEIDDEGYGIPAAYLPTLFERYGGTHSVRQKIGSGLGLYICRLIAERHGGSIRAEANPPQGTTFIITLPPEVALLGNSV